MKQGPDKLKVCVIDYGLGNLFSLERAIGYLGHEAVISRDVTALMESDCAILPGVGAFGDGINNLKRFGLDSAIIQYASLGRPLLGICLGMQLLFSSSEEFGHHKGLNLITGKVIRIPEAGRVKVPNVGWLPLEWVHLEKHRESLGSLVTKVNHADVYYAHSYRALPADETDTVAVSNYNGVDVCGMVRRGAVWGTQFHPEKSGTVGLIILKKFITTTASITLE